MEGTVTTAIIENNVSSWFILLVNLPVDMESQKEAAVPIDLFFELQDYTLLLLVIGKFNLSFVEISAHISAM